ncbi:hypothetical protein GCM10011400_59030 [Paraburkholderia caffeinilytica]|uniref:Uncharacterized protein n=1 Tax=Paraburkholderia caffeinilytica TaxID=1761016 RepID=A0ABQ1N9V2_9BURK|nr:hypothetical protein GCM10011400_59030 [Paraburkholderia caffeinilytica]
MRGHAYYSGLPIESVLETPLSTSKWRRVSQSMLCRPGSPAARGCGFAARGGMDVFPPAAAAFAGRCGSNSAPGAVRLRATGLGLTPAVGGAAVSALERVAGKKRERRLIVINPRNGASSVEAA